MKMDILHFGLMCSWLTLLSFMNQALAWCPWHPSLLASGGGTADRHIRFWNCNTGVCVNSIDTKSQVCISQSSLSVCLRSSHFAQISSLFIAVYPQMMCKVNRYGEQQWSYFCRSSV